MNTNEEVVNRFWALFDEAKFDAAGELMEEGVAVWWPNTREVFKGRERFILVNKKYPGRWRISVEKIFSIEDTVISTVKIENEDKSIGFYATSFFTMKNGLIRQVTEYFGDNGQPPRWRMEEALSEIY